MKTLKEIFDKHGSDKSSKHKYDLIYEKYFTDRQAELNFLEIGIFHGNSIAAWLEYFPRATIYCVDTFERISPDSIGILNNPRVKWLRANSMDPALKDQMKAAWGEVTFDYIIDDGLHTPEANKNTFLNLIDLLDEAGAYFIEDLFPLNILTEKEWKHPWITSHSEDLNKEKFFDLLKSVSDFSVQLYDNRPFTKEPDSAIMVICRK